MKKHLIHCSVLAYCLSLTSCAIPGTVSNANSCYPQSFTETHTKTTLVSPPSYSMPYLSPSAIYQSAPVAQPNPMQAPVCQPQYQTAQVCSPSQVYQSQSFQDPCANYGSAPSNIRYNVVGNATPSHPQYIVVQPTTTNQPVPIKIEARAVNPSCEEVSH